MDKRTTYSSPSSLEAPVATSAEELPVVYEETTKSPIYESIDDDVVDEPEKQQQLNRESSSSASGKTRRRSTVVSWFDN